LIKDWWCTGNAGHHQSSRPEVRYVRSTPNPDEAKASKGDLITGEHNHECHFGRDVDSDDVDAFPAILAATTPSEQERENLRRRHSPIEGPTNGPRTPESDGAGTGAAEPGELAPPPQTYAADE
jgi:hypothetical protein